MGSDNDAPTWKHHAAAAAGALAVVALLHAFGALGLLVLMLAAADAE